MRQGRSGKGVADVVHTWNPERATAKRPAAIGDLELIASLDEADRLGPPVRCFVAAKGFKGHVDVLDELGDVGLEEERRLAYVGLTRAKQKAIITSANSRRIHGVWNTTIPSRFIDELPKEHIEGFLPYLLMP